jgi:hypothetical protein
MRTADLPLIITVVKLIEIALDETRMSVRRAANGIEPYASFLGDCFCSSSQRRKVA